MIKRRLTTSAVNVVIQTGAGRARSGRVASCAEPAKASSMNTSACDTVSVDCAMATPVTRPHAPTPTAGGNMAATPALNAARRCNSPLDTRTPGPDGPLL